MADARVYRVDPGSLVVLRGVELEITLEHLMDGLERACGHRKFVVLQVNDGDAMVLGPKDLVEWLRAGLGVDVDLGSRPLVEAKVIHGGRLEMPG